ncbi:MAG: P-loop containing nucleoside triphosphate hydrolase protein [Olpidium bornovanus]|uniref:P-loop containing nucleoside triphosphate hydrolase protein n=1 Tax=Olpidium bornovanus TaxID=278681 RepID=A0A8H7ZZS9_9FUNG|nr:MAG: P-loop containing nucleoside triphosphate hydrolase protein [Olpidium bornovanus]
MLIFRQTGLPQYPFELDVFQKRAVYHLEKGDSTFVAAHTSAGKTAVAEYAIALAQRHMTRTIYTSPIKALSNQKFRDFRDTFDDVGILTGDVQIRPEASCLIMTTEILRSMLYRGADLIRDVEFVIFDEVHYVNDAEFLVYRRSSTDSCRYLFSRTKKKDIYVISTPKRPVPLEHYLYARGEIHKIVDARKKFIQSGYSGVSNQIQLSRIISLLFSRRPLTIPSDKRLSYKQAVDSNSALQKKEELKPFQRGGRGGGQRGGYSRGGGAAGSNRPSSSSGTGSGPNAGCHTATARNMYIELVSMLKKKNLLPTVIFTFSKKKCEEYAAGLSKVALTSAAEKSEVHVFIEKSLTRLQGGGYCA